MLGNGKDNLTMEPIILGKGVSPAEDILAENSYLLEILYLLMFCTQQGLQQVGQHSPLYYGSQYLWHQCLICPPCIPSKDIYLCGFLNWKNEFLSDVDLNRTENFQENIFIRMAATERFFGSSQISICIRNEENAQMVQAMTAFLLVLIMVSVDAL